MPHVAYVAWAFPPSRAGGTYRQLATANALAAAGWQVTVITVPRRTFTEITGADESLEALVNPQIEVVRTPFPWPLRDTNRDYWSFAHKHFPKQWHIARVAWEKAVYPEVGYSGWLKHIKRALVNLNSRQPIDLVLATANPYVAFGAAHYFHQRTGTPFVMDFRDAWALDVFSGDRAFGPTNRAGRLERRYITAAAQAWFVNQPIRDWYAEVYPDAAGRFRIVQNGWDPNLLPLAKLDSQADGTSTAAGQPVDDADARPSQSPRPLTFGYLGTVSNKVPTAELVEGWRIAKDSGSIPSDAALKVAGYLGYFRRGGRSYEPAAAHIASAADIGVEFVGPVPKAEVAHYYAGLDVLVLALGPGRYVMSGKVYEYMATGKPILSIHPPDSAASSVLEGYPLWAAVKQVTAEQVAEAISAAAAMVGNLTADQVAAARAHGARFTRDRQLAPAIQGLQLLVDQ